MLTRRAPAGALGTGCTRRRCIGAATGLLLAGCGSGAPPTAADGADCGAASPLRDPLPADALDSGQQPAPQVPLPPAQAAALEELLQRVIDRTGAPAVDAAVLVPGRGLWHGRLGWADRPGGRRVDAGTEFWWASCGKALTASLVLRAEQAGLLHRDDPLDRWFAPLALPAATRVLDLLRHTSTLLSYNHPSLNADPVARHTSPEELLARVLPRSRNGCPGRSFSYSNTNYLLLALLVQRVWNRPFHELVQAQLAAPLGLRLRALKPAEQPDTLARTHGADGLVQPQPGLSSLLGAGEVVGSAADWVRAWESLLQGRLAGPAAPRWDRLLDMALPNADSRSWYGLGVMAMDWRDARGRPRLWLAHTGGAQAGSNAVVLWDPLVRAHAAVAVNSSVSAVAVANALLSALEATAGP